MSYNNENSSIPATEILKQEYPIIYNGYKEIMEQQFELFARKHLDYGLTNVSAGTQLSTPEEKSFALQGLFFRLSDKINRWKNLIITKRTPQNETLLDTYQDITNYGIIAQLLTKDLWKK